MFKKTNFWGTNLGIFREKKKKKKFIFVITHLCLIIIGKEIFWN